MAKCLGHSVSEGFRLAALTTCCWSMHAWDRESELMPRTVHCQAGKKCGAGGIMRGTIQDLSLMSQN